MVGWFRLHRKLLHDNLWTSEPFTRGQAWVDLIGLARFDDGFMRIKGIKVILKRGQVGFSMKELAKRWKWSIGKVNRFIFELENEEKIVSQKNNVTTIITIINYALYQTDDTADDIADGTQTERRRNADGTQTETIKEIKEINNGNNEKNNNIYSDDFLKFWKVVKRDSSKNLAYAEWKKAIKIKDNDFIIKAYQYQLEQHLKTSELKFFKRAENWLKKSLYLNYEDQQIEDQSIPTYQRLTAIHGADIEFYIKYPDIHQRPDGVTDEELEECRQEMIKRGML